MSRRSSRIASVATKNLTETNNIVKKRAASEVNGQQDATVSKAKRSSYTTASITTESKTVILSGVEDNTNDKESKKSKQAKKTIVVRKEETIDVVVGDGRPRCIWAANPANLPMQVYHDTEWAMKGGFSRTNRYLFEMLILEGAQAGLSWNTIVVKRNAYREAYANFDYIKISDTFKSPAANERLLQTNIVKNRLKVEASLINARLFRELLEELYPDQTQLEDEGGFWLYLQQFKIGAAKKRKQERSKNGGGQGKKGKISNDQKQDDANVEEEANQELTATTTRSLESDRLSTALKKRGFKFVGTTICYTYLIATGVVEDFTLAHLPGCFRHPSNE